MGRRHRSRTFCHSNPLQSRSNQSRNCLRITSGEPTLVELALRSWETRSTTPCNIQQPKSRLLFSQLYSLPLLIGIYQLSVARAELLRRLWCGPSLAAVKLESSLIENSAGRSCSSTSFSIVAFAEGTENSRPNSKVGFQHESQQADGNRDKRNRSRAREGERPVSRVIDEFKLFVTNRSRRFSAVKMRQSLRRERLRDKPFVKNGQKDANSALSELCSQNLSWYRVHT